MRVVLFVALALILAGCASKTETPPETTTTPIASTASAPLESSSSNATTTNASTNQTGKDPNMPENPGNCMGGMDMPGCTQAQYDYYYAKMKANAPPTPPDKTLPPVKISLTPQGPDKSGAATIDAGTMQLFVTVFLNDTGPGPFVALGPGAVGDLKLTFKSASDSKVINMQGTATSVGVDPAIVLSKKYSATYMMPTPGDWTITLDGQGLNALVTIVMVESFSM